MIFAEYLKI